MNDAGIGADKTERGGRRKVLPPPGRSYGVGPEEFELVTAVDLEKLAQRAGLPLLLKATDLQDVAAAMNEAFTLFALRRELSSNTAENFSTRDWASSYRRRCRDLIQAHGADAQAQAREILERGIARLLHDAAEPARVRFDFYLSRAWPEGHRFHQSDIGESLREVLDRNVWALHALELVAQAAEKQFADEMEWRPPEVNESGGVLEPQVGNKTKKRGKLDEARKALMRNLVASYRSMFGTNPTVTKPTVANAQPSGRSLDWFMRLFSRVRARALYSKGVLAPAQGAPWNDHRALLNEGWPIATRRDVLPQYRHVAELADHARGRRGDEWMGYRHALAEWIEEAR